MSDLDTALCIIGGVVVGLGGFMLIIPWVCKFMSWYFDWVMDK